MREELPVDLRIEIVRIGDRTSIRAVHTITGLSAATSGRSCDESSLTSQAVAELRHQVLAGAGGLIEWFRGVLGRTTDAASYVHVAAVGDSSRSTCDHVLAYGHDECTCGWPSTIQASADASRKILDLHQAVTVADGTVACQVCSGSEGWVARYPCQTVRLLAAAYADRPGYREEWRP